MNLPLGHAVSQSCWDDRAVYVEPGIPMDQQASRYQTRRATAVLRRSMRLPIFSQGLEPDIPSQLGIRGLDVVPLKVLPSAAQRSVQPNIELIHSTTWKLTEKHQSIHPSSPSSSMC